MGRISGRGLRLPSAKSDELEPTLDQARFRLGRRRPYVAPSRRRVTLPAFFAGQWHHHVGRLSLAHETGYCSRFLLDVVRVLKTLDARRQSIIQRLNSIEIARHPLDTSALIEETARGFNCHRSDEPENEYEDHRLGGQAYPYTPSC